jgi:putative ABC transport system permease protein
VASALEQIGAVTKMNLRNIPQRLSSSLVAVLGIGGVSLVLVALLSIGAGFNRALEGSGQDDVAIVMRGGAPSEMASYFGQPEVTAVTNSNAIRRNDKNELMISPEIFGVVTQKMHGKDSEANLPLRGVGPMGPALRRDFKLVEGKMFHPGTNEIIVGAGVMKQYDGLEIGKKVRWFKTDWFKTDWTVVGKFTDDGGLAESEVWVDAGTLQQVWGRGPTVSTVRAKIAPGSSVKTVKDVLTKNPQLTVDVSSEKQFYSDQQKGLRELITRVGVTIAIIMGLAALFAALNTLESAVASRVREIATLRAMGFGAGPVVVSVLVEAMILGAIGGLVGGVVAYIFLNGITSSTLNMASFSQITYAFLVTPVVMLTGVAYGLVLCLLAGILPGIRAATMPITAGLREL